MSVHFKSVLNPNGIPSLSPGLRGTSYPGLASNPLHNPERVAANPRRSIHAGRFNPFRVEDHFALTPRVAPSSQFWAGQPGGLQEISRGLSAATPPVVIQNSPAPRRGARGARPTRRIHGSGIPSGCGTPGVVTGGVVALRAPQPPANFWQPSRLRASDFGASGFNAKAQRRKDAEKAGVGRASLSSARRGEGWASSKTSLRFRRGAVRTPRATSTDGFQAPCSDTRSKNLFPLCVSASLRLCVKPRSPFYFNHPRSHETRRQTL